MPYAPKVHGAERTAQNRKDYEQQRGSARKRGYGRRWEKYRLAFLVANPLCVQCAKEHRVEPAKIVDHIRPHKGDDALFWDETNHQALCKRCHDSKTAREDGGAWRPFGSRE